MAYPARYFKQKNFTRAILGGSVLADIVAPLDTEFKNAEAAIQQLGDVVRGITTADGRLKNLSTALAQALAGTERFSATAAQTAFVTTIAWDSSFDALNVAVFVNGTKVDTNSVTVADDGSGFLKVTLAAQTLGAVVLVMAYSAGAGVLTRLAATTVNDGASLVGLRDAANLYSATETESALAEVMQALLDYQTSVGDLAGLIYADGRNDFTDDQDMGGNKITGLANGVADSDAATYGQISAYIDVWNDLASQFLALTGTGSGAMTGPIEMGDNGITGLSDGVDPQDAATVAQMNAAIAAANSTQQPIGSVFDFAGNAVPTGFLECNGDAVSRTTYADLFAVLGTTWGAGDAVSTFNLPDLRGRFSMGAGTGPTTGEGSVPGTARALAAVGGFETHTLTLPESPAHSHTERAWSIAGGTSGFASFNGNSQANTNVTTDTAGGGGAHTIMNPFAVMKKMIKY